MMTCAGACGHWKVITDLQDWGDLESWGNLGSWDDLKELRICNFEETATNLFVSKHLVAVFLMWGLDLLFQKKKKQQSSHFMIYLLFKEP